MHTSARDFRNNRSGNTSTSRRNYFSSHCKACAQCIHIPRMSSVPIVGMQIGKWLFTLRIHAYVCNNPSRWWRMVGTELHWRAQRQNTQKTESAKHKANVIVETVYSVLKIIGHHSSRSNQGIMWSMMPTCEAMLQWYVPLIRFWTHDFEHWLMKMLAIIRKRTGRPDQRHFCTRMTRTRAKNAAAAESSQGSSSTSTTLAGYW